MSAASCSRPAGFLSIVLGLVLAGGGAPPAAARLLPSVGARKPAAEPPRPAAVPSDAELERQGARIGEIRFAPRALFDARAGEDASLFRLANRLHVATREATIEDQLLFKGGDPFRADQLAESARILRDARYLRDAAVRPVAFHEGVVDVEVTTQDVWTFNPGLSFGRRGGANTAGFELEELNFLGLGTQLGVGFKSGVDRDSKSVAYRDRHLGSSWWDLSTTYSDNSDGRLGSFALERPFYSLDSRWAAGVALLDDARTDARYDLGEIIDRYETRERHVSLHGGRSAGRVGGWVRRLSFGLTYDDAAFAPARDGVTALLPADRRLVYPWVAAEWIEDDFRVARNRDQIERTEDYSLGWRARAQLGVASGALGSTRDAVMLAGKASKGAAFGERASVLFEAHSNARLEGGALADAIVGGSARWYFRQSPRRLLFVNLAGEAGRNLDADHQVLLGGDNGLRGYPLRYQSGEGRWLLTAEQRFFTDWYPFHLFHVGAAVFYDMGATWGRDPLGSAPRGLLRDVGFGLRMGNARSALGNMIHLDVAFPLDGDDSIRRVQFLVETRKSF